MPEQQEAIQEAIPVETARRLAAALQSLLSTFAPRGAVTFREPRAAEALTTLPGPLATLTFRLSRGASGPAALVLPGAAALGLARMLLGESAPAPSEAPGAEDEDAFRELANQIAGTMASTLGSLLGVPVGFEAPAAAWLPAGGRELRMEPDATVLAVNLVAGAVAADAFLVLPRAALPPVPGSPVESGLPRLPETARSRSGNGMEMLLDISLPVTVELGRTRMMIRDILHLAPGSVLELDKLVGEPVDIMINDKPIAGGEVVVIDENFGVRLTSIVSPTERVVNLQ